MKLTKVIKRSKHDNVFIFKTKMGAYYSLTEKEVKDILKQIKESDVA